MWLTRFSLAGACDTSIDRHAHQRPGWRGRRVLRIRTKPSEHSRPKINESASRNRNPPTVREVTSQNPPITAVTMSLLQFQELASRQQQQIESTHRILMNKEQRLNYLSSVQDSQQGPIIDFDHNLSHFKEKIAMQEAKLRKLRLLKGQIQKQRCTNSNICKCVLVWQASITSAVRRQASRKGRITEPNRQTHLIAILTALLVISDCTLDRDRLLISAIVN